MFLDFKNVIGGFTGYIIWGTILFLNISIKADQTDSLNYSIKYKCTLTCDKNDFDKTILTKRLYLFGDLLFPKIANGQCKTEITVRLRNKPTEHEQQKIESFLTSHGRFGIYLLAKPEEIISLIDRINAAITFSNPSFKIKDIRDLLISTGEQIGVKEQFIGLVDSLITTPAIINALKDDSAEYRIWWAYKTETTGPNFGSSTQYEKPTMTKDLYFVKGKSLFNNNHISDMKILLDQKGDDFIQIMLSKNGKELFSTLTGNHIDEFLILTIDSTVLNCVRIFQQYSNGIIDFIGLDKPSYQYFGQMMITGELKHPLLICK